MWFYDVGSLLIFKECKPGRYGEECDQECPGCYLGDCDRVSGECRRHKCRPNFYGRFCNTTCVENCVICDEPTGHCKECDTNLTGSKCDKPCGEHCRHGKCIHGACADGCEAGYFGGLCSNVCNSTCISHICDTGTGICTKGCEVGWEGVFCEGNYKSTQVQASTFNT